MIGVHQQTFKAAIDWVKAHFSELLGTSTIDYSKTINKPSINGVTLDGNKTSEDLHIGGSSGGLDIAIVGTKVIFSRVTSGGITDIIISGTKVKFVKGGS